VPASSANLGPGFDVLAAALALELELTVEPAAEFELCTDLPVPRDRSNLVVRAFERLRPADGLRFTVDSAIPLSGGLGSSAAAVVAGLLAAREITRDDRDVLELATELEGHPDNVAAALLGGFVICAGPRPARLDVPPGLAGVLVVPATPVPTREARAALPDLVPLADAIANVAAASLLTLGLARQDLDAVAAGLGDRLHQPHRAHLYPRSAALLSRGRELGGIGATISGAGPTVLVWCAAGTQDEVARRLGEQADGWADVLPVSFSDSGARVATG
jgi:homoserine kinase